MNKVRVWVAVVFALGFLVNCGARPRQTAETPSAIMLNTTTPAEALQLWQQAEKAQKGGSLPTAIALWERIIKTYPNYAIAAKSYYTIGNIYLGQGQAEKALLYYDYLIYYYPGWEGIGQAKLDRMQAWTKTGRQKQAVKDSVPLWEDSGGNPQVRVGLSALMAEIYGAEGNLSAAFDWLTAGFGVARTPEEKKSLTQATFTLLNGADANAVQKLIKKNPPEYMKVFLYYQLARSEGQKGQAQGASETLRELLSRNPGHPVAAEMPGGTREIAAPVVPPSVVSASPANPERVGCLLPLNGSYAKYGDMVLKGLTVASEVWNEEHPQQRVTLVVKDSQADPDLAVNYLETLAGEDSVMAVVGPLGTQSAKAVAPVASRLGIPLLSLTQQDDQIQDNPYVVHVLIDNRELVRTLVNYCKDRMGATRFAVLYPDDRYGQNLSKIFSEVVKESGGSVLASVSYRDKSTDFRDPIEKLLNISKKNSPPTGIETTPFDVLFIPDQVQTVGLIAPQLPYNNVVGVTLLGTNLWGEASLVQAGGVYVERAVFATPFMADSENRTVRQFRERFETRYNAPPSYLEAQAYDALMLFLQARSGFTHEVTDRAALLRNLLQIHDFEGVAGTYSFNQRGELDREYMLFQVVNGQLVQLNR